MKTFIWRHFAIQIPDHWDMLQYSKNWIVGNCVFADRYQYRLEFNWRAVAGTPDYDRMLSDYMSKLKNDYNMKQAQYTKSGKWKGIKGYLNSLLTTRYGYYFKNESCVIEIVFIWPDKIDSQIERTVLNSIKEIDEKNGFYQWKAFHMDMYVSKELILDATLALPAHTKMTFLTKKPFKKEIFQRIGMVKQWLKIPLKDWVRDKIPKNVRIESENSETQSNHQIETFKGYYFTDASAKLLNRKSKYITSAWVCPEDERLYKMTGIFPYKDFTDDYHIPAKRLSCCVHLK